MAQFIPADRYGNAPEWVPENEDSDDEIVAIPADFASSVWYVNDDEAF